MISHVSSFVALVIATVAVSVSGAFAQDGNAWPADVKGVTPAKPGENPRLLFRKADLPALKERMNTPEGKAILTRLRATLNGSDGESMPTIYNKIGSAYAGKEDLPFGAYSMSHAAGYGLLYQLTGDKKYAAFGRECFEKAFEGIRDRDGEGRYSFRKPGGALRAGPSMGWYALGYDLCYDGWDPEFREKVAKEFSGYTGSPPGVKGKDDAFTMIESCILGKRQFPGSNHWGMEVGGAALAMLAIYGDPGCDMKKFTPLFEQSQKIMIRNMTEGFGNGGFFAEGDGTGSMSSHIIFLTALQAWKTAFGKDFISPRPNAQWMANRWFLQTLAIDGKPDYFPQRGGYPHNIWTRDGLSGGGYFSIGMGAAASDDVKAALLWFYNHGGFAVVDEKNKTPCDTPSPYPHHSVLSFVNWPVGAKEKNPGGIIPNAVHDEKFGFYAWRNRWQDSEDVIISILTKNAKGNMSVKSESTLSINNGGKKLTWGNIKGGFIGDFKPAKNGSTVLALADGGSLGVDFSGASGVTAMLVMTGPGISQADVQVNNVNAAILFLGKGDKPKPTVNGNSVTIGNQTVTFESKSLRFAK